MGTSLSDFRSLSVPLCANMDAVRSLDAEYCYRAVASKDARFDGWFFTAVCTTGIYCRPSCPAVTPRRANVEFFPTAAAAHEHGYRACKRCRPDAAPGSPEWDRRADVVGRAMRLVADGVVDRDGVAGLARQLSYSERHLNRLMIDELGAGPLAVARAQRATAARALIETSDMAFGDISFAAGFGSVRQFNETVRAVFASTPRELRANRRHASDTGRTGRATSAAGVIAVDLAVREPFDLDPTISFLSTRAIPGVEHFDGEVFRRSLDLPYGHGIVSVLGADRSRNDRAYVRTEFRLQDLRDLAPAVRRVRRWLDLDADPVAVDDVLSCDDALAPLVATHPGRRVPGSVDPFETAVRAVVGQQVSVAGARTIVGRITAAVGRPLGIDCDVLTHVFPSPEAIATLDPATLPMPLRRRHTLIEVGARAALGTLALDAGADRAEVRAALLDVPGIGPWTADYVMMRGFGDPDVFLPTDLGVIHGLAALGIDANAAEGWRPWRSYALHLLWDAALEARPSPRPGPGGRPTTPRSGRGAATSDSLHRPAALRSDRRARPPRSATLDPGKVRP